MFVSKKSTLSVISLSVVLLFVSMLIAPQQASAEVMGFKAWKAQRVEEAKGQLERTQYEPLTSAAAAQEPKPMAASAANGRLRIQRAPRSDSHLQQARLNLDIAQELNAHDYFVLYLSQLSNPADFQEAAKKLSPDEVVEILAAIKTQNNQGESSDHALLPSFMPAEAKTVRTVSKAP